MRRRPAWQSILVLVALVICSCGDGGSHDPPPPVATPTVTAGATLAPTPVPTVAPGAPDPSFGANGTVVIAADARSVPRAGLRVLADGSAEVIVLTRFGDLTGVRVVRVRSDGTQEDVLSPIPLAGFDAQGGAAFAATGDVWVAGIFDGVPTMLRFTLGSDGSLAYSSARLALLPDLVELIPLADGGMLAVGLANQATSGLQRFDADGRPDATFGAGSGRAEGLVLGPPPHDETSTFFHSAGVDDAGRVLVRGTRFAGIAFFPIVLAYDRQGAVDRTYGGDGEVPLAGPSGESAIAVTPDGVAYVPSNSRLFRVEANGVLAPVSDDVRVGSAADLAIDAAGDIVVVGTTFVPDEPRRFDCGASSGGLCIRLALSIERHHADGSIDRGFATNGAVVTDTAPPYGAQDTGFTAVVLAPPGRITTAGVVCRAAFVCAAVVARYGDVTP